jgi:hypothetical protein
MTTKTMKRLFALAVMLMTFGMLLPSAFAWKPKTHQYLASEALRLVRKRPGSKNKCKVRINYRRSALSRKAAETGASDAVLGLYNVSPEVCKALQRFPNHYMAGVCGPDCSPDVITPQFFVHPLSAKPISTPWGKSAPGTDAWMSHMWTQVDKQKLRGNTRLKAIAYVHGYLTHAAGDAFAHTLVNAFTDGPATASRGNLLRHNILEGYIGAKTPKHNFTKTATIKGLEEFLYKAMIESASTKELLMAPPVPKAGRLVSMPYVLEQFRRKLQRTFACKSKRCERNRAKYPTALRGYQTATYRLLPPLHYKGWGPTRHFKHWVAGIKKAERDWIKTGWKISRVMALGVGGKKDAIGYFKAWKKRNKCRLMGFIEPTCKKKKRIEQFFERIADALRIDIFGPLKKYVKMKALDFLDMQCKQAYAMTCSEIISLNPSKVFDKVLGRKNSGGPGCLPAGQYQQGTRRKPNSRKQRMCIKRRQMDKLIDTRGTSNFHWHNFDAAWNTVQMSKLLLLPPSEIHRVMRDLDKHMKGPGRKPRTQRLKTPNVMLGWLTSIDDSRQWCSAPATDGRGLLRNQKLKRDSQRLVFSRGSNLRFRGLFQVQSGVHPGDDCQAQRSPVIKRKKRRTTSGICVLPGSQVAMADGTKQAIEGLVVGDRVLAFDTATKKVVAANVTKTYSHFKTEQVVMLNNGLLGATDYHRVYTSEGWKRADALSQGDALFMLDAMNGGEMTVRTLPLQRSVLEAAGGVTTYNLAVDGPANFFANGVLVESE